MRTALAVCGLVLLGAGGCASADSIYRGLYQGLQAREDLVNPSPAYRPAERRLRYDEYLAERERRSPRGD